MKTKTPPIVGDHLPITPYQIKAIMKNCMYQEETKNEWVQWVTADVNRTSLKSITQAQAIKIILAQTGGQLLNEPKENWGKFDKNNQQHKYIMSLCIQKGWTKESDKWGKIADMDGAFSSFIQSPNSPVKKPLLKMTPAETSKIIIALGGVVEHNYK